MIFRHGVDHAPTNEKLAFFYFLVREIWPIQRSEKTQKWPQLVWKKKKKKKASSPFVCICCSNTRLKFQIDTRKIQRGIAVMLLVLTTTCLMYRNRFVVISWWVTNWAVQVISTAPLSLIYRMSTLNFTLIGNDEFRSCHTSGQKCRQKMVTSSFLGYLGEIVEIVSDSQTVWTCNTHLCATVSASNFQVLLCSGWQAST